MPTKSNKNGALKKGLTLPPGSLALTLIAAEDWDNSPKLLKSIYKQSSSLQRGLYLSCCERFGGNSLSRKFLTSSWPQTRIIKNSYIFSDISVYSPIWRKLHQQRRHFAIRRTWVQRMGRPSILHWNWSCTFKEFLLYQRIGLCDIHWSSSPCWCSFI